jgi:branched-chain amino acid transport system substrate-binding protein
MVSALLYNFKMPRFSFKKRAGYSWLSLILIFQISPMDSAVGVEKNIRIAFQGPLSGPEAPVGNEQLDGVKYAIQQFNKRFSGKINVSVSLIDDQGDPAVAQKIAPTFAAIPSILGIVGPSYSGASIASIPFYKAQNLAMISPSAVRASITNPAEGAIGRPVFHRIPSAEKLEGPTLYKIATEGVSLPKVIIVDDKSSYGVALSQSIKDSTNLGNIVATISAGTSSSGVIDWRGAVDIIKSYAANVVIYAGYTPQAATLYTQLRNSGYKGILAGGEGVNNSTIFDYATSSVLEGVRLTAGTAPLSAINSDLENNFRLFVGKPSGVYAAESIDATNVLLYCIATGVTTRSQMLSCIDGFRGTSVYGHRFGFTYNGDNIKQAFYGFEIKSGSIKLTQTLGRTKLSATEIITSFPWYNVSPLEAGTKVTAAQIVTNINKANSLNDTMNTLGEYADALNANVQDDIDAQFFASLASHKTELAILENDSLTNLKSLIELKAIIDSACLVANSDTSNTDASNAVIDACSESIDAINAADDAYMAANDAINAASERLIAFEDAQTPNISVNQIITYIDRSNAVLEKLYAQADSADSLNVKISDSVDAVSFGSALTYSLQTSALRNGLLQLSAELDDLIAQNSLCAAINADESDTLESNTAIEACAEFGDAVVYAISAFGEAESNTEALEAQLVLFNAAKTAADKTAGDKAAVDKAAADLKAKQEADAKAAAALKAKQEADAKAAADLKAKQEADAKAAADLRAKLEADSKAAAELRAKLEADIKAAADLRAKQEADTKAAAEKAAADLRAKQEADTKAAAAKAAADKAAAAKAAADKAAAAKAAAAKTKKSSKATCKKGNLNRPDLLKGGKCPDGWVKK